jgi:hypothetical protein
MIYDTLKLSKALRDKAHFTPEQAEALGEAAEADIATKSDIMGLKANIQSVRREIVEAKAALLKWIITALGLQTVVIIVAIIGAIITIVRSVH